MFEGCRLKTPKKSNALKRVGKKNYFINLWQCTSLDSKMSYVGCVFASKNNNFAGCVTALYQ